MVTASVVLALTYVGIAFARLPHVNIDRPSAAFIGGILMVLLGVLSPQEALGAIDFNTIALLLGMMLLVTELSLAGFFTLVASRAVEWAATPGRLLAIVTVVTAVLSA